MSCIIPATLLPRAEVLRLTILVLRAKKVLRFTISSSLVTSSLGFKPHRALPQTSANIHPSPGRWLVAQILKLLIAYITLHYDIQPLEERPLNTIFGDTNIPSMSATIRVRRRKAV